MVREHKIQADPSEQLKPPKVEKKAPSILTVEEVDKLLRQPDGETMKGIRDRAMPVSYTHLDVYKRQPTAYS